MMRAIRGQPNRGSRDLSSTMAWMSAWSGPFGPGFLGHDVDDNSGGTCVVPTPDETSGASKGGGRWRPFDALRAEEERPESAEQPVARRQIRRAPASTTQDDQLLFKQEILRGYRTQPTAAT